MAGWRFLSHELDEWCDALPRELREGVDYPGDSSYPQIRARLIVGARRRQCTARVWQHAPGVVRFVFIPAKKTSARVLRPGE